MTTQPIQRIRGARLQAIRARLLRADPLCAECRRQGRLRQAAVLDHVVALVNGGTNDEENLQGLCHDCHRLKTAADTGKRQRPAVGADGYPLQDAPTSAPAGYAGQILGGLALKPSRSNFFAKSDQSCCNAVEKQQPPLR